MTALLVTYVQGTVLPHVPYVMIWLLGLSFACLIVESGLEYFGRD